ncbi:putative membrane protein YqhA [Granulicella mallensis]|uniref:Putative membrane protein YqhA n=1 Tax=Granulicella mallensis TaxID=940614 RepID=A0A7W7ZVS5_9BACT|nr:putative membrane protein YqhA [Granulicella mallensis]
MKKNRTFLAIALSCGMLCAFSVLLSKTFIWLPRLVFFPSFIGLIVFFGLYSKETRKQ